jgi:hypothetical protein
MEGARKSTRIGTSGTLVGTGAADLRVKQEAGQEQDVAVTDGAHSSHSTMSKNDESPIPAKRKVRLHSPRPLHCFPPAGRPKKRPSSSAYRW